MPDHHIRTLEGSTEKLTISDGQGAITAFADSAAAPGVDTTVTSSGHGITQDEVDNGKTVTISGTTNYNGTFTVTRIVDANNFDVQTVFSVDDATGSFLVEKIFKCAHHLLTSIAVANAMTGGTGEVFVALQPLKTNDLQSSDILWVSVFAVAGNYFKGDSSLITGVKITGNPTGGDIEVVVTQGRRF